MKSAFRKLFSPILNYFESSEGEFNYRKSHRTILIIVGGLFLFLSSLSALMAIDAAQFGAFIPIVILNHLILGKVMLRHMDNHRFDILITLFILIFGIICMV